MTALIRDLLTVATFNADAHTSDVSIETFFRSAVQDGTDGAETLAILRQNAAVHFLEETWLSQTAG